MENIEAYQKHFLLSVGGLKASRFPADYRLRGRVLIPLWNLSSSREKLSLPQGHVITGTKVVC